MRSRLYLALMILIVILLAVPASLIMAADPPEPTYVEELPVVDGDYSEWDLDHDFFSDLYKHFDREPPDFIMGQLYLQYDCGSNVLCALVLVDDGPYWDPPLWLDIADPAAQFMSLGTDVLVDGTDLNSGTLPNMAWVYNDQGVPIGWEACVALEEGTYNNFNVQVQVWFSGDESVFAAVVDQAVTLELICGITAVDLASFTAEVAGPAIQLDWQTASEVDHLGFNLYRAESAGGPYTRLNAALIPGQLPGSPIGGTYNFLDTTALRGVTYYYWLEDVDLYGNTGLHGPVTASLKAYVNVLPGRPRPALAPVRMVQQIN